MAVVSKLRILTWKYLYFRKYYFMTTIIEIVLPILLVYFVLKIGHNFTAFVGKENEVTYSRRPEKTVAYYQKYTTIYYTSDDLDAHLLMDKCMRKTFDSLSVEVRPIIISTKTEAELLVKLLSNSSDNAAGVVFLTVYPVLRYKIRDMNSWKTDDLFVEAENEQSGPYEPDPYFDTGFAPLQATVNLAFICLMEIKNENFHNYFLHSTTRRITSLYEPFPYPEYTQTTSARAFIPLVVGFVIILCSLIQSGPIIGAIIVEKQSGLKEWMKMAGLEEKLLWFSWFINSLIISTLIYTVVTFLLICDLYGDNTALLRYIQPSLLWVCIVFFYIAQISFSFFFCALFHQSTIATASLAMITLLVAFVSVKFHDWGNALLLRLALLCPSGALMQSFIRFTYFELLGIPLTWSSAFVSEQNSVGVSLGFHLVALIFDTFLYFFLTYYISNINPGRYGFRKPWYFITGIRRPTFGTEKEIISESKRKLRGALVGDDPKRYIEPGSSNVLIDLQITNLRKTFNFIPVLRDVNLSVHSGEILVLLGHNGAGKTTLLSILTGLTPPTEGSIIFKENLDVINRMEEFRMHLGTCPQEDRLFPYLSVADHLIFFGVLKGASYVNVKEEAHDYLKLMELIGRGDELPYALSASLRRKLSLSIALMGKAEVLILDEPTAGIDDLSKRRIWKLLKKLKSQRTIIMTSNMMKEAAQVGDRIAILNDGSIACNGSIDFLKQIYGCGYQLKITRKDDPKAYEKGEKNPALLLIQTVFKGVVGSKIESRTPTELTFYLPPNDTAKFPALFKSLESKKNDFNIKHLGVSYTTLDQIFIKVVSQSLYDASGNLLESGGTLNESIIEIEHAQNKYTRKKLLLLQHIGMFKKKLLFLYRNRIIFTFRVILPTLVMLFLIRGTVRFEKYEPPLQLSLSSYSSATVIVYRDVGTNKAFTSTFLYIISMTGNHLMTLPSRNISVAEALLKYGRQNISSYRRDLLFAVDTKDYQYNGSTEKTTFGGAMTDIWILSSYNKWLRHSLPVLIDTIDNSKILFYSQKDAFKIITYNHPAKPKTTTSFESETENDFTEKSPILSVWFVLLAFFTIDLLDFLIVPTKIERLEGFKQVHFLSGVSTLHYWINTFLFDFTMFNIIIIIRVLALKAFDDYEFFTIRLHMLVWFLMFTLFVISGLFFMYVSTYFRSSKDESYMHFFIFNFGCAAIAYVHYRIKVDYLYTAKYSVAHILSEILNFVILLVPPMNYSYTFIKFIYAWRQNYAVRISQMSDNTSSRLELAPMKNLYYVTYLELSSFKNPNGILSEIIFLLIDVLMYILMLYVLEKKFLPRLMNYRTRKEDAENLSKKKTVSVSKDVEAERIKVDKLSNAINSLDNENFLMVKDLKKIFRRLRFQSLAAIENATFYIPAGECFALLGREGAGKTTTMKLLTGEILRNKGNAWIRNFSLEKNRTEYLSQIGYCAETNFILDNLTGREALDIVATLRGIGPKNRQSYVDKWLSVFDLEPFQNKLTSTFSGGNKRKLGAAIALIGEPSVILLDDPTVGMDPGSKRKLLHTLTRIKTSGQVVLLTTQSMEECENTCDRLTVLVKGEMKFIGSIDDLRKTYATGFTLLLNLVAKSPNETDLERTASIEALKLVIIKGFTTRAVKLQTQTENSLYYLIKLKLTWEETFKRAEALKKSQKIITDYLITEISLDEVYVTFYNKIRKE